MPSESEFLVQALTEGEFSPEACNRLRDLSAGIDLARFFETVDNSRYSLADWLRALEAFDRWLEEQGIAQRPVATMVGYLECCTLMLSGSLPPPEFASLAVQNLDRYGFDPAQEAKAE